MGRCQQCCFPFWPLADHGLDDCSSRSNLLLSAPKEMRTNFANLAGYAEGPYMLDIGLEAFWLEQPYHGRICLESEPSSTGYMDAGIGALLVGRLLEIGAACVDKLEA